MRTRHAYLVLVCLVLSAPNALEAHSTGVSGYSGNPLTNSGASCEACHSGGASLAVSLTGPVSVLPGSTNDYMLTLSAPPPGSTGGMDVSASAGEFTTFDAATLLRDGEVTHRFPMPADGVNTLSFRFRWTAPDVSGEVTLYGAGLSRDLLMGMGDTMGKTTLAITVGDPSAPEDPAEPPPPEPASPVLEPPVADAGGPYLGRVGEPVAFDGSGSEDPDGWIAAYEWDFGDGETGMGESPTHSYASPGSYTVSLTVVDETAISNTSTAVAEIEEEVPEKDVPEEVPVRLRVVAPRRLLIRAGHVWHVNVPVVVDVSELPPGTNASGLVVLFKNGEPVAEKPLSVRVPTSERQHALKRGHGGSLRLVRLLATVSSADAPSVEWSASIEILGGGADAEIATTEVRSFSPQPRRVRAVHSLFRR